MLTDKQREALNADLPRDAIRQRSGGGGRALSYVEGWWVIDRLNSILGPAGWSYRSTVERVHEEQDDRGRYVCTYLGRCVLTVGDCVIEDVGAGHGQDNNPGAAIEKAAKEAATDALKRCAKSLGRHLGLALYDKEQEHVGEPEPPPRQALPFSANGPGAKLSECKTPAQARAWCEANRAKLSKCNDEEVATWRERLEQTAEALGLKAAEVLGWVGWR